MPRNSRFPLYPKTIMEKHKTTQEPPAGPDSRPKVPQGPPRPPKATHEGGREEARGALKKFLIIDVITIYAENPQWRVMEHAAQRTEWMLLVTRKATHRRTKGRRKGVAWMLKGSPKSDFISRHGNIWPPEASSSRLLKTPIEPQASS